MAKKIPNSKQVRIIPVSDPSNANVHFRILRNDDDAVLFKAFDITDSYISDDRNVICLLLEDEEKHTPLLKVAHRFRVSSVTISSPAGILIGESVSELKVGCFSIKPSYTLLSRFGKQLLLLKGRVHCCPPGFKIKITSGGNTPKELAEIRMATMSSYSCQLHFTGTEEITENSRNLVLGMAIGILLQAKYGRAKKNSHIVK